MPSANAGWSCRRTLEHLCELRYSFDLATRASKDRPYARSTVPDSPIEALISTAHGEALLLSEVARSAPAGAQGYHPAGMADVEGFLAMAMDEQLIHSSDIATAFGSFFEPPAELVACLLDRLFPGGRNKKTHGARCTGRTGGLHSPTTQTPELPGSGTAGR